MASGGARKGAGRKPKTELYRTAIQKAERRIADKLPDLVDRLMELANGVLVKEFDVATGEDRVYQRPPDRQAAEYLINRIMGKPTDRKEHRFPDKPFEEMTEDELRAIVESED